MNTSALLLILLLRMQKPPVVGPTSEERCMSYTLYREASGSSLRDSRAVLDVLEHRMQETGQSCQQVVAKKHQFSWYNRNIRMIVDKNFLTRFKTVRKMRSVLPKCAMYFHNKSVQPEWTARMRKVVVTKEHSFYCT